jgi:Ca2+-binding EF-hand superfamily protein
VKLLFLSFVLTLLLVPPANAQDSEPADPLPYDPLIDDPNRQSLDPGIQEPTIRRAEDLPRYRRTASGKEMTVEEIFAVLDTNKSGSVDQAEWRQQSMTIFYMRDANENLELSREEVPGMSDEAFKRADLDGDGVLTGYEFNQSQLNSFETADANKDGKVTLEEFRAFVARFAKSDTP